MNEKMEKLERILERATAAADAPQRDLEPDTQSLREAWLAFGDLLEAAQPSDAPAMRELRLPPTRRRWSLAVATALAASLLIGLGVYWMSGGGASSGVLPRDSKIASTKSAKPSIAPIVQTPANQTASDLRWDDSLDQQIADAGRSVALARSDLAHSYDAMDFVRYGLQQTQQEFEKDKL